MSTNWLVIICVEISYNSIFFIFGLHNQLVQIPINAPGLAKVFIPPNSIVNIQNSVSTSKSWSPDTTFECNYRYFTHFFWKHWGNFVIACKKNLSTGLTQKFFSAWPLELRVWIWSSEKLGIIEVGKVISLCQSLWGFVYKFSHNCDIFL